MITNKEVKDALTHCIDKRWRPLAKGKGLWDVPQCALCGLFDGGNGWDGRRFKPRDECKGCPVYLRNGGKGCAAGSHFVEFMNARTPESAHAMLKFLRDTREHFFGGRK